MRMKHGKQIFLHYSSVFLLFFIALLFVTETAVAAVTITRGQSADIHWLVTTGNTVITGCTKSGGIGSGPPQVQWNGGTGSLSGTQTLGPFINVSFAPTDFTFVCTAAAASWSDTITVNDCSGATPVWDGVSCIPGGPPPTASWTSSPSCTVPSGGSSCVPGPTLTWTSSNVASVNLTDCGGGLYANYPSGPQSGPVFTPYPSGCYQIRNAATNLPISPNLNVPASCVSGTGWDGSVCALPTPPASAPIGLSVSASGCGDYRLNVSWNALVGATGYRVSRDGGAYIDVGNTIFWSDTPLAPSSPHAYTVLAYNVVGDGPPSGSMGDTVSSACPVSPTVATLPASLILSTSATLNATGNPNGFSATGWFRHSSVNPGACNDTFGTRVPGAGGTALGAGVAPVTFNQGIIGLTPATTYYYCAIASNAGGTAHSGVPASFITGLPAAPPPPTMPANFTVGSGAVWNVTMTGGGTASNCEFTRTSAAYGNIAPAMVGLNFTANAAVDDFIGPGALTYSARCTDIYGQWSPYASTVVTVLSPVPTVTLAPAFGGSIFPPSVIIGNTGTFTFAPGVQNTGETGSNIIGPVTTGGAPFACTSGCVYDSPAGAPLGLLAGSPAQPVTISFTPTVPGVFGTPVTFPGYGGAAPVVTGVAISQIQFSPPSPLDFGQVVITRSRTLTLRITNISSTLPATFTPTIPAGPFSCLSCISTTLVPGGYADFPITFTPVAPTAESRTMTLPPRPAEPTETVLITGEGVMPVFKIIER